MCIVIIPAAVVVLAFLTHSPEEVRIASDDGRVHLFGLLPQSVKPFSVKVRDINQVADPFVTRVYDVEPREVRFPLPLKLDFKLSPGEIDHPQTARIAAWNASADRWETISTSYDHVSGHLNALVRVGTPWAVLIPKDVQIAKALSEAIMKRALANPPSLATGYVVDLEYQTTNGDFLLFDPAYARSGCVAMPGFEDRVTETALSDEGTTYRIRVTWGIGNVADCKKLIVD